MTSRCGVAVSRYLGLLPDGEVGARRRRSCVGVQWDAWQDWILPGCASSQDPTYPPVSARLSLVPKPLWTFGFSDYEVWVTVPPPAWSKQVGDRLSGVAPYRYPLPPRSRFHGQSQFTLHRAQEGHVRFFNPRSVGSSPVSGLVGCCLSICTSAPRTTHPHITITICSRGTIRRYIDDGRVLQLMPLMAALEVSVSRAAMRSFLTQSRCMRHQSQSRPGPNELRPWPASCVRRACN
jgi:hypothetical protein